MAAKKITPDTYWRAREEAQRRKNITSEAEYQKEIDRIYAEMMDSIQTQINSFYSRYAAKEGITMADAKKKVAQMDIDAYARKAKKYVKTKDFTKQANEEMRLYNAAMKINRLEMLKANIGLEMVASFDELQKFFDQTLKDETLKEFERQAGILGETVVNNQKYVHAIVNASFHNATYSERIWGQQDQLRAEIGKQIAIGLIQGKHPDVLARNLRDTIAASKSDAERLMHTEMRRAQTEVAKQSYERNGNTQYEFVTTNPKGACPICRAIDGKIFEVKDMMPGENAPPMHPRCVLPGNKIIAPDIEAMTRSCYSGDIVDARTSNGTRFSVTANHIMLTSRGWVCAKNLVEGDKVVHYCGWAKSMVEPNPAYNDGIPTVEQLFATLSKSSAMPALRMPVSAEDFKGDVVPNSKVDIVFVDSKLRDKINSSLSKFVGNVPLIRAPEFGESSLSARGSIAKLLMWLGLSADGVVCGNCEESIFFRGSCLCADLVSLRRSSDYDRRLSKAAENDSSAYAEAVCESVLANPGHVQFDDVVCVDRRYFSGHVYDASSLSTLYIVNGIVSSNCHCATAPHWDQAEFDKWLEEENRKMHERMKGG